MENPWTGRNEKGSLIFAETTGAGGTSPVSYRSPVRRKEVVMDDRRIPGVPSALPAIEAETLKIGFGMAGERPVGSLLRTLALSKGKGRFLELGTGTGLSTAWILDG